MKISKTLAKYEIRDSIVEKCTEPALNYEVSELLTWTDHGDNNLAGVIITNNGTSNIEVSGKLFYDVSESNRIYRTILPPIPHVIAPNNSGIIIDSYPDSMTPRKDIILDVKATEKTPPQIVVSDVNFEYLADGQIKVSARVINQGPEFKTSNINLALIDDTGDILMILWESEMDGQSYLSGEEHIELFYSHKQVSEEFFLKIKEVIIVADSTENYFYNSKPIESD